MDLIKAGKRRSAISAVLYNVLNVGLAIAILAVVLGSGTIWPALLLVLLSKWRILAVRPRYWMANIQANLVDIIVSFSFVVLLFSAEANAVMQVLLTLLYIGWLLALKPRSTTRWVAAQAAVAVFAGVTALYMVSYAWPASAVVLGMWLIGYATGRHILGVYSESHILSLSLVWGLVFAEIGWITYHWAFAYGIEAFGVIEVPQAAVIALGSSFVAERAYVSIRRNGRILLADVLLPILLSVSVIAVMLLFFNEASISI